MILPHMSVPYFAAYQLEQSSHEERGKSQQHSGWSVSILNLNMLLF